MGVYKKNKGRWLLAREVNAYLKVRKDINVKMNDEIKRNTPAPPKKRLRVISKHYIRWELKPAGFTAQLCVNYSTVFFIVDLNKFQ